MNSQVVILFFSVPFVLTAFASSVLLLCVFFSLHA